MKAVLIAITFSLSPLAAMPALAADSIYTSWQNNLAVGGYDTVSFFSGKPQLKIYSTDSQNKLAKGSPNYWHVEDGKLYLNFNARIKRRWDRDLRSFIRDGDENWPQILND